MLTKIVLFNILWSLHLQTLLKKENAYWVSVRHAIIAV